MKILPGTRDGIFNLFQGNVTGGMGGVYPTLRGWDDAGADAETGADELIF